MKYAIRSLPLLPPRLSMLTKKVNLVLCPAGSGKSTVCYTSAITLHSRGTQSCTSHSDEQQDSDTGFMWKPIEKDMRVFDITINMRTEAWSLISACNDRRIAWCFQWSKSPEHLHRCSVSVHWQCTYILTDNHTHEWWSKATEALSAAPQVSEKETADTTPWIDS